MAKDKYHYLVKKALEDEGWEVTDDPLIVDTPNRDLEVDLGAEKLIGAEKGNRKIAIEIKSFLGLSQIHEFYKALGQFNYYFIALRRKEPERVLYLAVPLTTYKTLFQEPLTIEAIEQYQLRIIVYDVIKGTIALWKN